MTYTQFSWEHREGRGEQGNGKERGSQLRGAKLGSQDNSGKAAYFSSRHVWRSRKNKREKKAVVRPKMVTKANTEFLSTQSPTCTRGTEMDSLLQALTQ